MNVVTLTFPATSFQVYKHIADRLPYFQGRNDYNVDFHGEANSDYIRVVNKMMDRLFVNPGLDVTSHKSVFEIVLLARYLGVPDDLVSPAVLRMGQVFGKAFASMSDPEYLWPMYALDENLDCFNVLFSNNPRALGQILSKMRGLQLPEDQMVAMIRFFEKFDFTRCFEGNDAATESNIKILIKIRDDNWVHFLINPYDGTISNYFKYAVTNYDVWDCSTISAVRRPEPGEMTIAPKDTVLDRIREFTLGMLETAPNKHVETEFPTENVVFSGGSLSKLLCADYDMRNSRQSDVDLFIFGKTTDVRVRVFAELMEWFNTPHTYYTSVGSVCSIYIKNVNRKFQLISIDLTNPYAIINRFDISNVQWMYHGGKIYTTASGCMAMREKVARCTNDTSLRTLRFIKAMYNGYDILKSNETVDKLHLGEILSDPKKVKKVVRELHGWFYPQTMPDMTPEEETEYILSMIERDTKCTVVTADPNEVIDNIVIGGNFETGYLNVTYDAVDIAKLSNTARKYLGRAALLEYADNTQVTLMSSVLRVKSCIIGDVDIVVTVLAEDPKFYEFCNLFKAYIERLFGKRCATEIIGEFTLTMRTEVLNNAEARGRRVVKSRLGIALNFEDDIKPDDLVTAQFSIAIDGSGNLPTYHFQIRSMVKINYVTNLVKKAVESSDSDDEAEEVIEYE